MKGFIKVIIVGAVILVLGIAVAVTALGVNGWQIDDDYEMKTYECADINKAIDVEFSAGSLEIGYYDADVIKIEYPENKNLSASIEEKDGKLSFETTNKRKWFSFEWLKKRPTTKIWLPKGDIVDLELEMNAGAVNIADGEFGKFDVSMNAGAFSMGEIKCREMSIDMNAGTMNLKNVTANVKAEVDLSAGAMNIQSLISPIFHCDVSAGSVSVGLLKSGSTKIDLSAGSVDLLMEGSKKQYEIAVKKSAGSCNVSNQSASRPSGSTRRIMAEISAGSLYIRFESES